MNVEKELQKLGEAIAALATLEEADKILAKLDSIIADLTMIVNKNKRNSTTTKHNHKPITLRNVQRAGENNDKT